MENILGTFKVVCLSRFSEARDIWHEDTTGTATVVEKSIYVSFPSNDGFKHPLEDSKYRIVRFQGKEYLLTGITDGLDGMAVCLMVKEMESRLRIKLYTDTPTPKGQTAEAVRENARQTIQARHNWRF